MSVITVYLAGPMLHDPNANRWRKDIIESNNKNNIEFINPFDLEPPNAPPEQIVETDLDAIDHSDVLLVRWKEVPTAGTPMEMRYAYENDIPIVTWWEGPKDDLSKWVRYHSDKIIKRGSTATTKIQRLV